MLNIGVTKSFIITLYNKNLILGIKHKYRLYLLYLLIFNFWKKTYNYYFNFDYKLN